MELRLTQRGRDLVDAMTEFMNDSVLPAEAEYHEYRTAAGPDDRSVPPVVNRL